jgi:hypothetical protein
MEEAPKPLELTKTENVVVRQVTSNMRAVGLLMVVYGVGLLLGGLADVAASHIQAEGWAGIVEACALLVLGIWTQQVGTSFSRITTDHGIDRGHALAALDKLRGLYRLQKWLMILGLVLFLAVSLWTFFLIFLLPRLERSFAP